MIQSALWGNQFNEHTQFRNPAGTLIPFSRGWALGTVSDNLFNPGF
ncbi:uncharacterized protein METZ01_LOCUS474195 [marine metagenome]|uniref:Uncharacterized protein n=1 Tax=marine metagenome TaxID=408172 RepID=A0A383BND6_9ZZZZ